MQLKIIKYRSEFKNQWDEFIESCNNGTFLFKREFMEYHQDRFIDFSLLVFNDKSLIALLPASLDGKDVISSHSGLTYGGLVVRHGIRLNEYLEVFKKLNEFLNKENIKKIRYKAIPLFYKNVPFQEEEYALFLMGAKNYRTDTTLTFQRKEAIPYQKRRIRSLNKSKKNGLEILEVTDLKIFWNSILIPNLRNRFNRKPTHTIDEISFLRERFPDNIKHFNVLDENEVIAGCTIFEMDNVAHAQYIASNQAGKAKGALDFLFDFLISTRYRDKEYFDFGIVNENNGLRINQGLLDWKEGFGARTFVHKFYEIDTANYNNL